jgi:hypothetical protein
LGPEQPHRTRPRAATARPPSVIDLPGSTRDSAYSRWLASRLAWGKQHGVDAVDIIREQVEMRRAAYGWVDGHAPGIPRQLDDDP